MISRKVGLRLITSRDGPCKNARVYIINLNETLELAAGRGAYGGKVSLSILNEFFEHIFGAGGGINFLNLFFSAGPDIICFLRQSQGIIRFTPAAKGVALECPIRSFFVYEFDKELNALGGP